MKQKITKTASIPEFEVSLKIINQYIINHPKWKIKILFECENNTWYITNYSGLNGTEICVMSIPESEAKQLLK